jgi:hypothetical protein
MEELEEQLNLMIKTVNNDVYNINATHSTSVFDVKHMIRETTSIDVERQRLIYRGKVMVDESSIRDYNIESGHTIHMVARPANFREMQQNATAATTTATTGQPQERTRRPAVPIRFSPSEGGANTNEATAAAVNNISGVSSNAGSVSPAPAENNLESIRQGLLTMHTLFSTVNSVNHFYNNNNNTSSSSRLQESKPSAVDTSVLSSERRFFIGQWLDVKDTVSQWLEATVMEIDQDRRRVFVHYNGWPQRWDEWLAFDSPRISPFRTRTIHTSGLATTQLSPTPNVSAPHAPVTGVNDIRTILPELANVFRNLQPLIEEMAVLSEESLKHTAASSSSSTATGNNNNTSSASSSSSLAPPAEPAVARGMPWDNLVSGDNNNNNNSQNHFMNNNNSDNDADAKEEQFPANSSSSLSHSSQRRRSRSSENRTPEEIDSRLQLLSRDACPLFDRFGRLMADVSPHLWNRAMPGINRPTPSSRFDPFQSLESRLISLLRER